MTDTKKIVIIGGVAAGPKVGSKIIRMCPEADVTLIEKGEFLSYAGCGLPYYVSGVVKEQAELMSTPVGTVRDSVFFQNVKNIHVFNRTEAIKIDKENKKVSLKSLTDGAEKEVDYDKLIIATGASPVIPPINNINLKNVFTLHGVEDAEGIKAAFSEHKAKDVTIIGGGLIGIEMAEALNDLGARVTIMERLPQILTFLDLEMSQLVVQHLESKGVKVLVNTTVTALKGVDTVEKVITNTCDRCSDVVIVSVGVKPNISLAKDCGLEIGNFGGIIVNDQMQTSDEDIYAAGDCVETKDIITGKNCLMPLGSIANKQGRVAAINICSEKKVSFPGVLKTAICKVFDYGVSSTGLNERTAKEQGFNYITVMSPAPDKAHFYPDAKLIMLKMVVDATSGRLLGMQAIGPGGVDKRIDVAVTAITASMTVDDIAELDLAYAPPFSPAMDNIITAANIARNKLAGCFKSISPVEVQEKLNNNEDIILLDVRSDQEYEITHLENSTLIPLGGLRDRCESLPKDKDIIVYCKISLRGYEAALILKAAGFTNVVVMDGGLLMWPYKKIIK